MVVFSQDWHPTYAEALDCAKENDRPLLLVFSGSDWCAPCIKLDALIWQSEDFKVYAKDNYVLYRADFPRRKDNQLSKELANKNNQLAERFNSKGHFPLVIILNKEEEVMGTTGYKKTTPEEYVNHINTYIK